jgi:hypothetical protein
MLCFGCRHGGERIENVPVIAVDVSTAETPNFEGKVGVENIVALETSPASLIQKIDKLFITEDYLIVISLGDDFNTVKGKFFDRKAFFPTSFKPRFFRDGVNGFYFAYPFSNVIYRLEGGAPQPFLEVDLGERELPYDEILKITSKEKYEQLTGEKTFVGDVGDLVFCGEKLFFSLSEIVSVGVTGTFRVNYDTKTGVTEVYNSSNRVFPANTDGKYPLKKIFLTAPLTTHDGLWVYAIQPFLLDDEDVESLRVMIPAEISEESNPLLFFCEKMIL